MGEGESSGGVNNLNYFYGRFVKLTPTKFGFWVRNIVGSLIIFQAIKVKKLPKIKIWGNSEHNLGLLDNCSYIIDEGIFKGKPRLQCVPPPPNKKFDIDEKMKWTLPTPYLNL